MIRDAQPNDREQIYNLWNNSFSVRSGETVDSFFRHGYSDGKTVVCEMDDKLVATVFMNDMNIMFRNRCLKASFLSRVNAHPDYRKTNALDETLKSVLDECEKRVLFTFVEATSYKFWENYGFQNAAIHRFYELEQRHFEKISIQGVDNAGSAHELKEVYDEFMRLFDGYKLRSLYDFEKMLAQCEETQEQILIVRHGGKIRGYIYFYTEGNQVKVKELIYLSSHAFLKLCKAALAQNERIILELSEAEHIEKIFPLAIPRKRTAIMVRCNNLPLFNKLYNSKVKTSADAYALIRKPKYMNEKY